MMTRFIDLIKRSRETFLDRHYEASDFYNRMFSALTYSTWLETQKLLELYCKGLTLDAGSGRGAWTSEITNFSTGYESIEMAPRGNHKPTWLGDVTDMSIIPEKRYDTVFCQQVLEHVPDPLKALREMNKVLKPDGRLILTVPHLSRRHEIPHDYYRYTQNGIEYLFEQSGYKIEYISGFSGLFSFIHHQTCFLFPGLLMTAPIIAELSIILNVPFTLIVKHLDTFTDQKSLLPGGISVVGKKLN